MNFNTPVSYIVFDDTIGTAYVIDNIFFTADGSLPVELTSFHAGNTKNGILLEWNTKSESNNAGWDVESRSQNSEVSSQKSSHAEPVEAWTKVGFISGKGTTTDSQNYQFKVSSSEFKTSNVEFRLKQIDLDGKFAYSNILKVDLSPNNFGLSQNYPNPFNPTTVINYSLQVQSDVKLVVFDLLGREVATLVNGTQNAGIYSVNFNGKNLTSGLYFYTLTSNGNKQTRSMILTK